MRTRESFYEVSDLSLAAALAALGIAFQEEQPFVKIKTVKGGDQYRFFLKDVSQCGTYKTGQMVSAWNDDGWHLANPEHPFAYIKCAFKNRDGLLDVVKKSSALIVLEKNGKMAIISQNASPELQNKIFSQL